MRVQVIANVLVFAAVAATFAETTRPPREVYSANKQYQLRIEPGSPSRVGESCTGTLFEQRGERASKRWERAFVNDIAPCYAFVRDDGRFVVTLDEFRRGGARHALVIYGERGELLRHFLLTDLLDAEQWKHVQAERRSVAWLTGATFSFDNAHEQFVIKFAEGTPLRIDLQRLAVVRADGTAPAPAGVPDDVLALVLPPLDHDAHAAPNEEEQAELTDPNAAADVAAADGTDPNAALAENATDAPADAPTEPAVAAADATEPAGDTSPSADNANTPADGPVARHDMPIYTATDEQLAEVQAAIEEHERDTSGIDIPLPNPAEKTDYVTWLNSFGVVPPEDDAGPLYERALAAYIAPDEATENVLRDAAQGDATALNSPTLQQWLQSNSAALGDFLAGSKYPAAGWHRESESGMLVGVLLPNLSGMRRLGRAAITEGRLLVEENRPQEAAQRYMDSLAAARHVGTGMTLIESLVSDAMQAPAADAWLDMLASPQGQKLDYTELSQELQATYQPGRPMAQTVQGERAMMLDMAQRSWQPDPQTGELVPNPQPLKELVGLMGDDDAEKAATLEWQMNATTFEDTVNAANTHYDAMTRVLQAPYPQAIAQLAQVEAGIGTNPNPFMRTLLPSLARAYTVQTRAEATRRATLLATELQAYHQQTGTYPDDLSVFEGAEYTVDPFSNQNFAYRRDGESFTLYSLGENMQDDGGVHDPKGATNDLRFWPRPPKQ